MKKDSRPLTEKEKGVVSDIIVRCLKPLNIELVIPDEYLVIHCWSRSGNNEEKWDEYFYHINVSVEDNNFNIHVSVNTGKSMFEFSWLTAWKIFHKLDLSVLEHPAAKTLWGERKKLKDKYTDLTWAKE